MTKRHADNKKKVEMADRRRDVAALYLAGKVQTEIAAELGVNQATVSRDLTALQKMWAEQALRDLTEAKAEQLAKIDRLEREYWEAWKASQGEQTATSKKLTREGQKEKAEASTRVAVEPGDPRFLDGVQWCIEQRCKILGINAAIDVKGNLGVTILNKWKQQAEKQMEQVAGLEDDDGEAEAG